MLTNQEAIAKVEAMAQSLASRLQPSPLTVGLSGGADSTLVLILATYLRSLNPAFKVRAVHCIHGLDADDPIWLAHCKKLCIRLNVELITPKLNIIYGNGVSPEDSSRKERYKALIENKLDGYLMLGHQQDDQVENFLLALKRGAGPYGLSGMKEIICDERGYILRPLLNLKKKEIEEIISALGFDFVFDISNEYLKFERNFIRLKVLPLLRSRFPGIDKSIIRSSSLCAIEHDLAERYVKEYAHNYIQNNTLDFSKLNLADKSFCFMLIKEYLSQLKAQTPEFFLIEALYDLMHADNDVHALFDFGKYKLRRYKNTIIATSDFIFPDKSKLYQLSLGQSLKLGSFTYTLVATTYEKDGFYLNNEESVTLNFSYLRSLKLKPKARAMRREIKKLFNEYQIEPFMRDAIPLVSKSDGSIVALGDLFVHDLQTQGEHLVKLQIKK